MLVFFLLLMIGFANLHAQVDTVYNLGTLENRISLDEINKSIAAIESRLEKDTTEWVIQFETKYEELQNDTLIRYGTIHVMELALLSETAKEKHWLNQEAPKFLFEDLNGDSISLNDLRGKVTLVNFWFTRCPPCIAEMPYLNQIKKDYQGKDVNFLSMAPENRAEVIRFLEKHPFSFRHIPDADAFLKKFGVGFPKNILIDRKGIVRYVGGGIVTGYIEEGAEEIVEQDRINWDELKDQIEKLLRE